MTGRDDRWKLPDPALPEEERVRAYRERGRRCAADLPENFVGALAACYRDAGGDPGRFIELVHERDVWPIPLEAEGNRVDFYFPRCFCEHLPEGEPEPLFCECSVGWMEEFMGRVSGGTVEMELLAAVLRGDERCRLRVTFRG
jgi:hypothetical protein